MITAVEREGGFINALWYFRSNTLTKTILHFHRGFYRRDVMLRVSDCICRIKYVLFVLQSLLDNLCAVAASRFLSPPSYKLA
jgi:hypothetical protein